MIFQIFFKVDYPILSGRATLQGSIIEFNFLIKLHY